MAARNAAAPLLITSVLITVLLLLIGLCLANFGPTIKPNPNFNVFSAATFAKHLHDVIEQKNEDEVTQVICSISNKQRQQLANEFKKIFSTDLIAKFKEAFTGDFEDLIIALIETPAIFDANQMHDALIAVNTNETLLVEILAMRTNRQIRDLKIAFTAFDKLEHKIIEKTNGHFQNLLIALLSCSRDESMPSSLVLAHHEAMMLFKDEESRKGLNASALNQVLSNRSFEQLLLTFDFYKQSAHHDIETGIKQEFDGHGEAGFLTLIKCIRNSSENFADLLHNSMKEKLGTRNSILMRLVVSHSEIDLADIKHAYHELHKESLEEAIKANTSDGAYQDALLALVRGNHSDQ